MWSAWAVCPTFSVRRARAALGCRSAGSSLEESWDREDMDEHPIRPSTYRIGLLGADSTRSHLYLYFPDTALGKEEHALPIVTDRHSVRRWLKPPLTWS